jgi:hypothetical protein
MTQVALAGCEGKDRHGEARRPTLKKVDGHATVTALWVGASR